MKKDGVDIAGLQELCINWSGFKTSQKLALLLWVKAENIFSVASYNKQETENIGRYQRGGIRTIIVEQLAAFMIDSGVEYTGL